MSDKKTVIIGFSRPKSNFKVGSWFIRLANKTKYSHVYMKTLSTSLDRVLLYEATGHGGVNFINQRLWESQTHTVIEYSLDLTPEQHKKLLQFCIDNAGQPYSKKQIINIAYNYIRKFLGLSPVSWKESEESMICSELLGRLLCEVFNITPTKDFNLYEPVDIENILKNFNNSL